MASPQVSRKSIVSRFRTADTAVRPGSPVPSAFFTPSSITPPASSTLHELAQENDMLRNRCEELALQSQLNQQLFQRCSHDLLAKEDEVKDLQDQITKFEELIVGLKAHIQVSDHQAHRIEILKSEARALGGQIKTANVENDALIHSHKVEAGGLQEQLRCAQADADEQVKQFAVQSGTLNALQAQYDGMQVELDLQRTTNTNLELQIDLLTTQVAQATNAAYRREKLIATLKTQLQQLVKCHAIEEQVHVQQKQALNNLYEMSKADQLHFETQSKAQNLTMLSLQQKLDRAETDTNKVAVAYEDEVAELNEKLRRADLDLRCEVAKNVAWENYEPDHLVSKVNGLVTVR